MTVPVQFGDVPRIVVAGPPLERGRQYGQQARARIRRSIANYREIFAHRAGLDWEKAVRRALGYEKPIAEASPATLAEMRGIAEGAGVELGEILALNARSELMFVQGGAEALSCECSSFAVLPEVSETGHTIVGQNWDWVPCAAESVVMVVVRRDDGPDYVTVAEAGHVAKVGVNAAGLGVCTNTLVSTLDDGRPGVPYHVLLRMLLDAGTMSEAMRVLYGTERGFSANYLIAHADGLAANIETLPGGTDGIHLTLPDSGVLAHANHFQGAPFARVDARVALHPNTIFRADSLRRGLASGRGGVSVETAMEALRGHRNHPDGVCSHPDPRTHRLDQRATIVSVVTDLNEGTMWFAPGPPCSHPYERIELGALWNEPVAEDCAV